MPRETRFDVQWQPVGEKLISLKPLTQKAREAIGELSVFVTGVAHAEMLCRRLLVQAVEPEPEAARGNGFDIRATLRRVLPAGSTKEARS